VITLWDVLEHIDKADTFIDKCTKLNKPGSYLVLQVPQIDSYFAKRHKDQWKMMGLDHVNYFSKKTITKLLSATKRPDKVIGMHFMNPVPVMKLVEVIRGYKTDNETTRIIMNLSETLGKVPVEVNDYPGFIANRILMPMINEAIYSLKKENAEAQQVLQQL